MMTTVMRMVIDAVIVVMMTKTTCLKCEKKSLTRKKKGKKTKPHKKTSNKQRLYTSK